MEETTTEVSEDQPLTPEEQHDKLVKELRKKHKRLVHFFDEEYGSIVYRRPKRDAMQRFVSESQDDEMDKLVAMETLLMSCRVHPDGPTLRNIFDELSSHVSEGAREVLKIGRTTGRGRRGK